MIGKRRVRHHLGVSIHGDRLSGVAIELHGKRVRIVSCVEIDFDGTGEIVDAFRQLLELSGIRPAVVMLGLPLSMMSVRNLEFPFSDVKKIGQALPFELDDQLVQSADRVIIDFSVIEERNGKSRVLAVAAEKERLRALIEQSTSAGLEPAAIVPSAVAIAETVGHHYGEGWHLVLQTDTTSVTMVIICEGRCRFCRRLSYPEEMVFNPPFVFKDGRLEIVDHHGTVSCLDSLVSAVGRSQWFLKLGGEPVDVFSKILVTGVMAGESTFLEMLGERLGVPIEGTSVSELLGAEVLAECSQELDRGRYEASLCLAVQGMYGKPTFTFRKGELSPKRRLPASGKQLAALAAGLFCIPLFVLGFYFYDQGRLKSEYEDLSGELLRVYRGAFPDATRVQDPYVQMKVTLRELEASGRAVPAHSGKLAVLDYLADISTRIPDSLPLQVSRLVIDDQAVRMRGLTENFNRVDEIKSRLSASPHYDSVQIMSATADKKTNKIRFEIQLSLGGIR